MNLYLFNTQGEWLRQGLTFDIGEYIVGEPNYFPIQRLFSYKICICVWKLNISFVEFRLHGTGSARLQWWTSIHDFCLWAIGNRNWSTATGRTSQIRSDCLDGIVWRWRCHTRSRRINWLQIGVLNANTTSTSTQLQSNPIIVCFITNQIVKN